MPRQWIPRNRQTTRASGTRFTRGKLPVLGLCAIFPALLAAASGFSHKPTATKPPVVAVAKPSSPPAKVHLADSRRDFCNLVFGCGLTIPAGYCPDTSVLEKTKIVYDNNRCQEARLLNSRGVKPDNPDIGFRLYRFLGYEYRIVYTVEADIPISEARLAYLLADLPLAAKLISYFQKSPYTAQYVDPQHKSFVGSKGKHLRGDASLISGSTGEKRLFYFGIGVADVAWWTLRGPALMDFSYGPAAPGKGLRYKMKILVFPGNGVINGIMNLGLFRKIVNGKIQSVLLDITETAHKLAAASDVGFRAGKEWTPDERKKIEAFLKLP